MALRQGSAAEDGDDALEPSLRSEYHSTTASASQPDLGPASGALSKGVGTDRTTHVAAALHASTADAPEAAVAAASASGGESTIEKKEKQKLDKDKRVQERLQV
jgi:hypothetical protein